MLLAELHKEANHRSNGEVHPIALEERHYSFNGYRRLEDNFSDETIDCDRFLAASLPKTGSAFGNSFSCANIPIVAFRANHSSRLASHDGTPGPLDQQVTSRSLVSLDRSEHLNFPRVLICDREPVSIAKDARQHVCH